MNKLLNCPKHVVSCQNIFVKLVQLVGFIVKKTGEVSPEVFCLHKVVSFSTRSFPLLLHILMQSWVRSKCAIMSSVVFESNECRGYKPTGTLTKEITVSLNRVLLAKTIQRYSDLLCINFLHVTLTLSKSGRVALSELPNWQRLATESRLIRFD